MEPRVTELVQSECDVTEKLREQPIDLIEERSSYTEEEMRALYPEGNIVVCDFAVDEIENGFANEGGYAKNGILSIDHHAPVGRMQRQVSSTNLAIEFVDKYRSIPTEWPVIVNHTDADSVMSSLITRGVLAPDERFGEAAIAADHTGEANEIADLLQSCQIFRDIEFSARNLQLLLQGQEVEPKAAERVAIRLADRENAKKMVAEGAFQSVGRVAYTTLERKIDPSFLPSLLPSAGVILTFSPMKDNAEMWEVKIRLGQNAPEGMTLQNIGMKEFDPIFGGRWNAGSNKRGGGTALDPETYVVGIAELVEKYIENHN